MACIKIANYQTIASLYAEAQAQVLGIADYYYQAALEIVLLQEFDPELDLLSPFYNAYLSAQTVYLQAPQAVVNAVSKLQTHVLDKARTDANVDTNSEAPRRFTDINQWIDAAGSNDAALYDNVGRTGDSDVSFRVPRRFADLSSQAGYAITENNIS